LRHQIFFLEEIIIILNNYFSHFNYSSKSGLNFKLVSISIVKNLAVSGADRWVFTDLVKTKQTNCYSEPGWRAPFPAKKTLPVFAFDESRRLFPSSVIRNCLGMVANC